MPRQRFQRKDLKRPDEFVTEGLQLLAWASENTRLVSAVGVGVLLLIVAFLSVGQVREARSRQASDDLGQALADFQAKNYAEAAPKLADVSTRWESTTPGRLARLFAADARIESAKYDDAANLLQDLPDKATWPPYLLQHAALSLGAAAESKKDYASAAARYSEASAMEGPYTALAIFAEGRCRELAGQKDQAKKLYERLTHEFPQAVDHDVAAAKLEALNG